MNTNTVTIQSFRKRNPVYVKELRAINSEANKTSSAAIISISEKIESNVEQQNGSEVIKWVMPPLLYPYMKGRDNDPL